MAAHRKTPNSGGFTLVELLVVISIIGILIALLLPAVQSAREAARRLQCANNFKQVGLALHNYHASHATLPIGTNLYYTGSGSCPTGPGFYNGMAWGVFVFPYLEMQSIYDQYDFSKNYFEEPNWTLGGSRINLFLCPSDPQDHELVWCCTGRQQAGMPEDHDMAKTNMAGVHDSIEHMCQSINRPSQEANGVLYAVSATRFADISDGTSSTLMVGEILGGGRGTHRGVYWHSWDTLGTQNGINGPGTRIGEDLPLSFNHRHHGGFASEHPGGCHFAMVDGSVHFLSENIDAKLLAALTTRSNGEVVGDY